MQAICPECGAATTIDQGCQSNFHALLAREAEVGQHLPGYFATPSGQTAHFYAIACYALQHPNSMGYRVTALLGLRENLTKHLTGQATLAEIRTTTRQAVNGKEHVLRREGEPIHDWGITHWPITVADILAAPPEEYAAITRRWADATLAAIHDAEKALAQGQINKDRKSGRA